jgi:hypothetical protein
VTRVQAGQSGFQILAGTRGFSLPQNVCVGGGQGGAYCICVFISGTTAIHFLLP